VIEWTEILQRLLLACLFGGLVGLERERKSWAAGMRTHMMVCLGSALIMIVSAYGFNDIISHSGIELDPSRIAAQVVSGIGFIGAGTILFTKTGNMVRGLTTAAGLWTVAGVGLATGAGLFTAAAFTTVLALIILWALQPLEKYYAQRFKQKALRISTTNSANTTEIIQMIENIQAESFVSFTVTKEDEGFVIFMNYEENDRAKFAKVISELQKINSVKEVHWEK